METTDIYSIKLKNLWNLDEINIIYLLLLEIEKKIDMDKFNNSQSLIMCVEDILYGKDEILNTIVNKYGVNKSFASFSIPLGATINMDGTAIMQGCATYFLAAYYGIDLVFSDFVLIILTATVASIGTAGIPSAGIIMLSLILTELGIPLEGITLLLGVDRLLDMMRTCVNVSGDTCISCVVAQSEKLIDVKKFNQ